VEQGLLIFFGRAFGSVQLSRRSEGATIFFAEASYKEPLTFQTVGIKTITPGFVVRFCLYYVPFRPQF